MVEWTYSRRRWAITITLDVRRVLRYDVVVEELQLLSSDSAVIYAVNASNRLKRGYGPPVGIIGDVVTHQSDRATSRIAKVGQTGNTAP